MSIEDDITTIILHLNERAQRHFRTDTKAYRDAIRRRLKDEDVDTIKLMIDYRVAWWWKTDMQQYLDPDTLFRPSKFPKYVEFARQQQVLGKTPRQVYRDRTGKSGVGGFAALADAVRINNESGSDTGD